MEGELRFPRIVAVTLSGKHLVFPDSIGESGELVPLAFRRHAPPPVDSWTNPISRRLPEAGKATFYEVPVLAGGWRTVSGFLASRMRSPIPPHRHDVVAPYSGNALRVQDALSIDDLDTAYAYVIDEDGKVHFHDSGWASPEKISRAFEALTAIVPTS